MLRLDHQAIRQSEGRQVVARPDRAGKVAMTTRVSPRVRKIYKVLAAELDTTMEEMQVVALRSILEKLKVESERRAAWEALRKEFADCNENAAVGD